MDGLNFKRRRRPTFGRSIAKASREDFSPGSTWRLPLFDCGPSSASFNGVYAEPSEVFRTGSANIPSSVPRRERSDPLLLAMTNKKGRLTESPLPRPIIESYYTLPPLIKPDLTHGTPLRDRIPKTELKRLKLIRHPSIPIHRYITKMFDLFLRSA